MASSPDIFLVPAQFPTIQSAVDAVVRPTTIVVWPGAYDESVVVADKESVVIQSSRLSRRGVVVCGDAGHGVFSVSRSTLSLSGIEVRSNGRLRGLAVRDSTVSLQECVVAGNRTAESGAGMDCRGSSVRLQKSVVVGNTVEPGAGTEAEAAGGGLWFHGCSIEIAGCTLQANACYSGTRARGGGIWCGESSMRMWRSRVTDNALRASLCEGAGIYFRDPGRIELGGSVITGNGSAEGKGGGIFVEGDPSG